MKTSSSVCIFVAMGCSSLCFGAQAAQLNSWVPFEGQSSVTLMMRNVSAPGTAPGSVIASPSQQNPDYYYHWVRDASMTMNTVVTLLSGTTDPGARTLYLNDLMAFVDFSRQNQLSTNPSGTFWTTGLGEPKFNVDGSVFNQPWGRPQNDGPALRAITLSQLANLLLASGQEAVVRSKLYDSSLPANTVIKADLEYVSHHWQDPSFDLWEEVRGTHFFTHIVMRRALLVGARLADRLGDSNAAGWYRSQAQAIANDLARHWDAGRGYIMETLDSDGGGKNKWSNLDSAVVLGALSGCDGDHFLCPSNDAILSTAFHLQQAFEGLYGINKSHPSFMGVPVGTAIGRYPEDTYTGISVQGGGNPWFITTAAFAELCYRAGREFQNNRAIPVSSLNHPFISSILPSTASIQLRDGEVIPDSDPRFAVLIQAFHDAGDRYLARIAYHSDGSGMLTEQMNRDSGYMQGAHDLTWSYSSFLEATWAK